MLIIDLTAPPPAIPEQTAVQFTYPAPPDAKLELRLDGGLLLPFMRPGEQIWRWDWQSGPAVGSRVAALWSPAAGPTAIPVRITPRKLSAEHHQLLLQDLQLVAVALAARLAGATAGAGLGAPEGRSAAEEIAALFGAPLDTLERAVRQIAAQPRQRLAAERAATDLGRASRVTPRDLADAARGPLDAAPAAAAPELQAAIRPGGGLLPRAVAAPASHVDLDSYEHRLTKRLLELLAQRARMLGEQAQSVSAAAAAQCTSAGRRIGALLALPLFKEVGALSGYRGPTPLLQRDAAYRTVHRAWLALRQSTDLTVESPLFALPVAELPRLYEIWCALVVAQATAAAGNVTQQALLRPASGGFALALPENTPLLTVRTANATLTLRYQPRYAPGASHAPAAPAAPPSSAASPDPAPAADPERAQQRHNRSTAEDVARCCALFASLDRHTRVPDLTLEIARDDAPPELIVFDAKYRLDFAGDLPEDALADAYAYLGAIGYGGRRCVALALLLYPGGGAGALYPSAVGALPLLPGAAAALDALLATLIA